MFSWYLLNPTNKRSYSYLYTWWLSIGIVYEDLVFEMSVMLVSVLYLMLITYITYDDLVIELSVMT